MAQLIERLLLTTEICSLNPVIGRISIEHLFIVNCIEETKIKKKEEWNGPLKKVAQVCPKVGHKVATADFS